MMPSTETANLSIFLHSLVLEEGRLDVERNRIRREVAALEARLADVDHLLVAVREAKALYAPCAPGRMLVQPAPMAAVVAARPNAPTPSVIVPPPPVAIPRKAERQATKEVEPAGREMVPAPSRVAKPAPMLSKHGKPLGRPRKDGPRVQALPAAPVAVPPAPASRPAPPPEPVASRPSILPREITNQSGVRPRKEVVLDASDVAACVERHIREKGVKKCPAAIVGVTTAELSTRDRAAIAQHTRDQMERSAAPKASWGFRKP